MWTAEIELNARLDPDVEGGQDEAWIDAMSAYSPVVTRSVIGNGVVTFSVAAENLRQAADIALLIVADRLPGIDALVVKVMLAETFDARAGLPEIPPLLSLTQAAERAGISRAAMHKRVTSGKVPHGLVGTTIAIPAAALEAEDS